jgi:hypothetical protein
MLESFGMFLAAAANLEALRAWATACADTRPEAGDIAELQEVRPDGRCALNTCACTVQQQPWHRARVQPTLNPGQDIRPGSVCADTAHQIVTQARRGTAKDCLY